MKICSKDLHFFQSLFQEFVLSFSESSIDDFANNRKKLHIPKLSDKTIFRVLTYVTKILEEEKTVLELSSPIVVIGDLHGQLLDLMRILKRFPILPSSKFLFLGDYVDRGQFSTETIVLVLLLKILYPDNIFIIRGNHEFVSIFQRCGFYEELKNNDHQRLIEVFTYCFSYMPLAAIIDGKYLCLHGGIGPSFTELSQFNDISRPIHSFSRDVVSDILWSDPCENVTDYEKSNRGTGHFFSKNNLELFLKKNGFQAIIRGHQCISNGVSMDFGGKCITIFSASNYCGKIGNFSGCINVCKNNINTNKEIEIYTFEPLNLLKREDVFFEDIKKLEMLHFPSIYDTFYDSLNSSKTHRCYNLLANNENLEIIEAKISKSSISKHQTFIKSRRFIPTPMRITKTKRSTLFETSKKDVFRNKFLRSSAPL